MPIGARRQPQGLVRLNRTHPWTRYVTGAWPFNGSYANVADSRRKAATVIGTPYFTAYPDGQTLVGVASSRIDTGYTATQLGINGARKRTILLDYVQLDTNDGGSLFSLGSTTATGAEFALFKNNFTSMGFGGYFIDLNFQVSPGSSAHRIRAAVTYDGATLACYAISTGSDGVKRFTGSSAAALATSDGNPLSFLSGAFDNKGQFLSTLNSVVVLSDRVLTQQEIEAHFAQPNAIYEAPSQGQFPTPSVVAQAFAAFRNFLHF